MTRKNVDGQQYPVWVCACSADDLNLHKDIQVFSNIRKISAFEQVMSLKTLEHPVFIVLTSLGIVTLAVIIFREEASYVPHTLPSAAPSWRVIVESILITHPLLSIFFRPSERLSPRKLLMLYYTRLTTGVGFSSFFRLGTNYEKMTLFGLVLLSAATAIVTSVINLMLLALLQDDPTSIQAKSRDMDPLQVHACSFGKARILLGGLGTIIASGTAYYCIIAIGLQSTPEALATWMKLVIFSFVQDQIVVQLLKVTFDLLAINYLIHKPHFKGRSLLLQYIINNRITELWGDRLQKRFKRRSHRRP
jgi:hypothetical protein